MKFRQPYRTKTLHIFLASGFVLVASGVTSFEAWEANGIPCLKLSLKTQQSPIFLFNVKGVRSW